MYLYYAKDLNPSNGALDEDEFLEVVRYPFDQVVEMILNHEIKDAKTIATVLKYKLLSEK